MADNNLISHEIFTDWKQAREAAQLKSSGGGGTSDGMEGRIAKLEAHMETVRSDIGSLKADVRDVRDRMTRLETKVDHLPSKGFVVTATTVALTLIAAITLFQTKLQVLFGLIKG